MRRASLMVAVLCSVPVGAALAQEMTAPAPATVPASATLAPRAEAAATTAAASVDHGQVGINVLPMPFGKVTAASAGGGSASSDLDFAYGIGLSFGYRVVGGLYVGVAPQIVFNLSAKDAAGYPVIDSEREYDLMARIAYAYAVAPKLALYAEVLPGFAIVTYDKVVVGSHAPSAKGIVVAGGVGATYDLADRFFANVGVGYQQGLQKSSGIIDQDLRTRFIRIALGAGVKF